MEKRYRKNEQIRGVSRVMLVVEGDKPQVVPIDVALRFAYDKQLDLVEINPHQDPPVVKAMDYGSFLYHESKRAQENSRKNKEHEMKEVRFRPVTDDGDFKTKSKQIIGFIEKGHKVKVAVRFKGREITNLDAGFQLIKKLVEDIKEIAGLESQAKMEGRQIMCIIAPVASLKKVKVAGRDGEVASRPVNASVAPGSSGTAPVASTASSDAKPAGTAGPAGQTPKAPGSNGNGVAGGSRPVVSSGGNRASIGAGGKIGMRTA